MREPADTAPSPPRLDLDTLGDGLGRAATVLRANAVAAGLDAPVPTCPGWTVRDLVAHQGMVHRWATGHITGDQVTDTAAVEAAAREEPDPLGWFDDGATALLQALADAPDDLDALVFLLDAGPARMFWTRRQCHETTIHAVDALAARLGRPPARDETWIRPELALDGIDELLTGFLPRPRMRIHTAQETTVLVRPDGTDLAWRLALGPDHPVEATMVAGASPAAYGRVGETDHELVGHPVDLYLRLWNRAATPDDWWRDLVTITWR